MKYWLTISNAHTQVAQPWCAYARAATRTLRAVTTELLSKQVSCTLYITDQVAPAIWEVPPNREGYFLLSKLFHRDLRAPNNNLVALQGWKQRRSSLPRQERAVQQLPRTSQCSRGIAVCSTGAKLATFCRSFNNQQKSTETAVPPMGPSCPALSQPSQGRSCCGGGAQRAKGVRDASQRRGSAQQRHCHAHSYNNGGQHAGRRHSMNSRDTTACNAQPSFAPTCQTHPSTTAKAETAFTKRT